ncbi:CheB methylesterase [Tahibacter aquaticus]|uniref:protein-glutamate methylesterase n=1 Tax=Tahibacter aquaticus TaxID=520092 RepID=A0A4R6Z0E0_9GAMM|nr:chemotaxis protein CheB [Tahibacter aquaticus]TDR44981.1 CheB methylesterase [Tahibacter aquaticus]
MSWPGRRIDAIAIGASFGGVEALKHVLPALPAGLPVAVFVVLHLPRERESLLGEIFAPLCALRVREVMDKDAVVPGSIYFAPPSYHLLIDRGPQLALSMDDPVEFSRPSVTVLFESVAAVYAEHALGLILTGAGGDGAEGLAAIQREGGLAVVQQPASARMPNMPASALQRISADYVLTLDEIMTLFQSLPTQAQP